MKLTLEEYLAQFSDERVNSCFSYGPSSRYGREGTYYCANCDISMGEVHESFKSELPRKNEEEGHCWECRRNCVIGEDL